MSTTPDAVVDALRTQVDALAAELGRLNSAVDDEQYKSIEAQREALAALKHADSLMTENDDLRARLALAERAIEDHDELKDAVVGAARDETRRHTPRNFAMSLGQYCAGCSSNASSWPCEANPLIAAIARLDATSPREDKP